MAAVGWVIVPVLFGCFCLLGKGGVEVDCGEMGSFKAEATALDILLDNVLLLFNHNGVLDNS